VRCVWRSSGPGGQNVETPPLAGWGGGGWGKGGGGFWCLICGFGALAGAAAGPVRCGGWRRVLVEGAVVVARQRAPLPVAERGRPGAVFDCCCTEPCWPRPPPRRATRASRGSVERAAHGQASSGRKSGRACPAGGLGSESLSLIL